MFQYPLRTFRHITPTLGLLPSPEYLGPELPRMKYPNNYNGYTLNNVEFEQLADEIIYFLGKEAILKKTGAQNFKEARAEILRQAEQEGQAFYEKLLHEITRFSQKGMPKAFIHKEIFLAWYKIAFATHFLQERKIENRPFIKHPEDVARRIVQSTAKEIPLDSYSDITKYAVEALIHDVREDIKIHPTEAAKRKAEFQLGKSADIFRHFGNALDDDTQRQSLVLFIIRQNIIQRIDKLIVESLRSKESLQVLEGMTKPQSVKHPPYAESPEFTSELNEESKNYLIDAKFLYTLLFESTRILPTKMKDRLLNMESHYRRDKRIRKLAWALQLLSPAAAASGKFNDVGRIIKLNEDFINNLGENNPFGRYVRGIQNTHKTALQGKWESAPMSEYYVLFHYFRNTSNPQIDECSSNPNYQDFPTNGIPNRFMFYIQDWEKTFQEDQKSGILQDAFSRIPTLVVRTAVFPEENEAKILHEYSPWSRIYLVNGAPILFELKEADFAKVDGNKETQKRLLQLIPDDLLEEFALVMEHLQVPYGPYTQYSKTGLQKIQTLIPQIIAALNEIFIIPEPATEKKKVFTPSYNIQDKIRGWTNPIRGFRLSTPSHALQKSSPQS